MVMPLSILLQVMMLMVVCSIVLHVMLLAPLLKVVVPTDILLPHPFQLLVLVVVLLVVPLQDVITIVHTWQHRASASCFITSGTVAMEYYQIVN